MSNLIFIGTLHGGSTPAQELISLVEGFQPTVVLVEINQQDIQAKETDGYPEEMQAVLRWAESRKLEVYGFDSKINPIEKNTSESDLGQLDKEQREIIEKYDWKDFNKEDLLRTLRTSSWHKTINLSSWNAREQEMYKNIHRFVSRSVDPVVVVTGSGHISFFKSKFPAAQFPLS